MNDLTAYLVRETVETLPRAHSLENGDKFASAVIEKYNLHMTAEYLVPLLQRVYRLWQYYHPERFEYDDDGNFWPKYWDDELVFSGICKRILQRHIDRTPELQLNDWGDLPIQLVNPDERQVQEHYPDEFKKSLAFQKVRAATFEEICRFLNKGFGKPIPVENIARAVVREIEKDPLLGLPLFG